MHLKFVDWFQKKSLTWNYYIDHSRHCLKQTIAKTWDELYAELLGGDNEVEPGTLAAPEWYLPEDGPFSLSQCFCQKLYGRNNNWQDYRDQLVTFMRQDTGIQELSNPD
jgi:hypothetical protein